jgi:hypothetical protein
MTFVEAVEIAQSSPAKRASYSRVIYIVIGLMLAYSSLEYAFVALGPSGRPFIDFDAFHLAGQLVWRGEINKAYSFASMAPLERSLSGRDDFLPWTYPPQFDLVVALLALLPLGLAYVVFTAGTLAAYLAVLKKIAAQSFVTVLILMCPVILLTLRGGQNGFLTGALIGLLCLGMEARAPWAGAPLGLMIVKPHLAIAFAIYALVNRCWRTVFVAAGVVAATFVLATVLLGPDIWAAFIGGIKEAGAFLEQGLYQLPRMVSPYAAVRSFNFPAWAAGGAQFLTAIAALGLVARAGRRFSRKQSLGLTAIASPLISPYAYDYDLPILGVGLALLLPALTRVATDRERLALYVLVIFAGGFGMICEDAPVSLAGFALLGVLGLTRRLLQRSAQAPHDSAHKPFELRDAVCADGSTIAAPTQSAL